MAQEFFRSDFRFTSCLVAALTYYLPLITSLTRGRTLTKLPNGRASRDAAPLTKAAHRGVRRQRGVAVGTEHGDNVRDVAAGNAAENNPFPVKRNAHSPIGDHGCQGAL